MAENKKSFMLYVDQRSVINDLTDEEAGKLIKHIYNYCADENPVLEDRFLKLIFDPIKQQLKRDLEKYRSICERNSKNGSAGGRPKEPSGLNKEPKKPSGFFGKPKEPKKADTDIDIDNDKEIDKDIISENEILATIEFVSITGYKNFNVNQVKDFWKAFLTISEKEFYKNRSEKIKHFRNWLKKQDFIAEISTAPVKSFRERKGEALMKKLI